MWESYILLPLLNSLCGATRYTRRNRHYQDYHHCERVIVSLNLVQQRRKGLYRKAKNVDYESGTG